MLSRPGLSGVSWPILLRTHTLLPPHPVHRIPRSPGSSFFSPSPPPVVGEASPFVSLSGSRMHAAKSGSNLGPLANVTLFSPSPVAVEVAAKGDTLTSPSATWLQPRKSESHLGPLVTEVLSPTSTVLAAAAVEAIPAASPSVARKSASQLGLPTTGGLQSRKSGGSQQGLLVTGGLVSRKSQSASSMHEPELKKTKVVSSALSAVAGSARASYSLSLSLS